MYPIDQTIVLHDFHGARAQTITEENEVRAWPPRIGYDKAIAIEKMSDFGDFLGARIFLHALGVGKLAVAGRIEPERCEVRQRGEMQSFG